MPPAIKSLLLLLLLAAAIFTGCATPAGVRTLPGGQKAQATEYRVPGTNWVLYTTYQIQESAMAALVRVLRKWGHRLAIGGVLAAAAAAAIFFIVADPRIHALCTPVGIIGAISFICGIVVSLLANPWILAAILIAVTIGAAALIHTLWTTRHRSLIPFSSGGSPLPPSRSGGSPLPPACSTPFPPSRSGGSPLPPALSIKGL